MTARPLTYSPTRSYGHAIRRAGASWVLSWRHMRRTQDGTWAEYRQQRVADADGARRFAERWGLETP